MNTTETREPAVAGKFYTAVASKLRKEIEGYLAEPAAPMARVVGVMVPHAGYIYSGAICGHALASVEVPASVLILHTKHHMGGGEFSLATFNRWRTPLGDVEADTTLARLLAGCEGVEESNFPHYQEHAAEVVIPFLQVLRPDVRVAAISVGRSDIETITGVGKAIGSALAGLESPPLLVASTDMNHYREHHETLTLDEIALERLRAFDTAGMLEACERHDITMCGANAMALMLEASKLLGATRVEQLEHTTSAPASGNYNQTVGYASARVL